MIWEPIGPHSQLSSNASSPRQTAVSQYTEGTNGPTQPSSLTSSSPLRYQLQWVIDDFDTTYSLCLAKQKITSPESTPVDFFASHYMSGDNDVTGSGANENSVNDTQYRYSIRDLSISSLLNAGGHSNNNIERCSDTSASVTEQLRQYTCRIMLFPKGIKSLSNYEKNDSNNKDSVASDSSQHSLVIGVQFRNQSFDRVVSADMKGKDDDSSDTSLSSRVQTLFSDINKKYPPPTVTLGCTVSLLNRKEDEVNDVMTSDGDVTNHSSTTGDPHEHQEHHLCTYDCDPATKCHETGNILLTRDINGAYTVPVPLTFQNFGTVMKQIENASNDKEHSHTRGVDPILLPDGGRYKLRILITAECAKGDSEVLFDNVKTGLRSFGSVMSAAFSVVGRSGSIKPVAEMIYKNNNFNNNKKTGSDDSASICGNTIGNVIEEGVSDLKHDEDTHEANIDTIKSTTSFETANNDQPDENQNTLLIHTSSFSQVDISSEAAPKTPHVSTTNANANIITDQRAIEGKLDAYLTTLTDPPSGWSPSLWNLLLHVCSEVAAEEVEHSKLADITTTDTHIGTTHPDSRSSWITEENIEIWKARGYPTSSAMSSVFTTCPPLRQRHREFGLSPLAQQALWGLTVDMVLSFSCLLHPKDRLKRLAALADMRASSPWAVAAVTKYKKKQLATNEEKRRNGDYVCDNYWLGSDSPINSELFDICSFVFDPSEFFFGSGKENDNSDDGITPMEDEKLYVHNNINEGKCELDVNGTKEQCRKSIVTLRKTVHEILDVIVNEPHLQHKKMTDDADKLVGVLSGRSNDGTISTECNSFTTAVTFHQLQEPLRNLRQTLRNISLIEALAVNKRATLVERIKYIVEHGNWGAGAQEALSNAVANADIVKCSDERQQCNDAYRYPSLDKQPKRHLVEDENKSDNYIHTSLSLISQCVRTGEQLLKQVECLTLSAS